MADLMDVIKNPHLNDWYDKFATCQEWRFAIADYLYWQHSHYLVEGFRPSYEPVEGTEDYEYGLLQDMDPTEKECKYAYAILTRYREWLRIAGKDY